MKSFLSIAVVLALSAASYAIEPLRLGQSCNTTDAAVDASEDSSNFLIALAPLQQQIQKQQLQAPVQKLQQVQKQQQVQKLSLKGHSCAIFPARRERLQEIRADRQQIRQQDGVRFPLLRLRADDNEPSAIDDPQFVSLVQREVQERTVQENPNGNQCNSGGQCNSGQCTGGRRGIFRR